MKKNILILILFFISFTSLFADTFVINQAKPYNKFEINYLKDETSTLSINQIVNQEFKEITKKEVLNRFMVIPSLKESTIVYC